MDYVLVCIVSLLASGLTLYSGFGLGTLLMPAFAVFFPLEIAIAATAVVHLANNIFKLFLLGRQASWSVVIRLGVPAAIAAIAGAWLLTKLEGSTPLATYTVGTHVCHVTIVKLAIACVVLAFAVMELSPGFDSWSFEPKWVPVGGVISGFFGGLSGHQGALRSAFLRRLGLSKQAFIATGVVCAVIIDVARLGTYGATMANSHLASVQGESMLPLVVAASLAAFLGAFVGSKLVQKVTMRNIQVVVGVALLLFAVALGAGII
jgi:uncharacterized membrane protein YfcA